MLFYFSATGNTEHVVEEIKTNGESVVFIPDAIKKGTFDFDVMDNRIGILSPTYFWGLPSIVKNFLEKAHFNYKGKPYCFLRCYVRDDSWKFWLHCQGFIKE